MAIFEKEIPKKVLLDDTEPLICVIENWRNTNGHTEFVIKVTRGPITNKSWKVYRRYNDFAKLHSYLQTSGLQLPFPPKKIIGNMDPGFISQRQLALQNYLNVILMNPILVSSLPARSFIDPATYCQPFSEVALQHVSLSLRGEVGWEVVAPLTEIGWRLRKHYYQVKCKNNPKEELWANWVDFGPDKYLEEKNMQTVFKSLSQIQHPYIHSMLLCMCTDVGGLIVRPCHKDGSLRDMLSGVKPKLSFLKKYGNPKGHKSLDTALVALYGRQILEALKFLHDKGLPYGHLHTGNIIISNDRVQLLDIENGILGVPSFYRPYFMQYRKINTLEAIDVYCFGQTLYEMAFGTPLQESVVDDEWTKAAKLGNRQTDCPAALKSIIESILTADVLRSGLPTLEQLLQQPFFATVILQLDSGDKAHLKISTPTREHLRSLCAQQEERLREEQKITRSQKRLVRVQELMSSEEELKKQRQRLRHEQKLAKEQQRQRTIEEKDSGCSAGLGTSGNSGTLDNNNHYHQRPDSVNSSSNTSASLDTATPPTMCGPPSSNHPPPPPPPPPPMAPMNGAHNGLNGATKTAVGGDDNRSVLLGSICNFNKGSLRKTKTKPK